MNNNSERVYDRLTSLVKIEAANLLKYAKKSELDKLNINTLMPSSIKYCVYGQMTGNCESKRAYELFYKCNKYFVSYHEFKKADSVDTKAKQASYFSPIEWFLFEDKSAGGKDTKTLIKYLKGENKTLKLTYKPIKP